MRELYRMVELVARSESTVMILGESGTGKERVAEAIHRSSPRAAGPFVRVSCAALNENLLESELFGHVKGAFTGAVRDRRGRFQEAHGGTLLLDEIGDVSPAVQVKLLRVIEQREIERVGDSQPIRVDVRLLCATHRDLRRLVADGRFRADLYFRLEVFPLRVPALREHPDDLPLLAERFLAQLAPASAPPGALAPDALAALRAYAWPGNVRELQNVMERAAVLAGDPEVDAAFLHELGLTSAEPASPPDAETLALEPAVEQFERKHILRALAAADDNKSQAARLLGVSERTLWYKLKRYGL
jgi:transcriptional regulator with GAF, ATPase, and Fis domain